MADIEKMDKWLLEDTYSVAATCSNCGHKGRVLRKRGERMPDTESCPNCGCHTFCIQKYFG